MAIHPIDYRYGTPEMRAVWARRTGCVHRPGRARPCQEGGVRARSPLLQQISSGKNAGAASLSRAKEIEAEINHDMMAIVNTIAEVCARRGMVALWGDVE